MYLFYDDVNTACFWNSADGYANPACFYRYEWLKFKEISGGSEFGTNCFPESEFSEDAIVDMIGPICYAGDSGLDIDALKIVANGVNQLKREDNAQLVITHYQRLLDYIVPDYVHVLHDGRIVKSGGKGLALELEEKGYDWITGNLQTA